MTKNNFVIGILVVVLIAIGVNGFFGFSAYHNTNLATRHNCEEIEEVKDGLRSTIEEAQQFVKSSRVRSKEEKEQSETYYTDVLAKFRPRNCETELNTKGIHAPRIPTEAHIKLRDKAIPTNK